MIGQIYIGLDFGMALTKVAVWSKLPQARQATRFVVEFPRDNDPSNPSDPNRALHVPSSLWIGNGRIHGIPSSGTRRLHRIDGIKKMMLDGWSTTGALPEQCVSALGGEAGWCCERLAILKLAFILRYVDGRVNSWLSATHPGSRWITLINAAVPPEEGEFANNSARTIRMRSVVERAWQLAQKFTGAESGLAIKEALRLVNDVFDQPLQSPQHTRVDVIPEALAAACFHITGDTATLGNWLTVDVGALTTDISYFFFNPGRDYRVACYSSLQSRQVGTNELVGRATLIEVKGRPFLPHEALAVDPNSARSHDLYDNVIARIEGAIRGGLTGAMKHQGSNVSSVLRGSTPLWRVLLVGGGSTHDALEPRIRAWRIQGLGPVDSAECHLARLPGDVQVLGANSLVQLRRIAQTEQAILTIAVGLAQRRIDLPKWRQDAPEPAFVPRNPPEHLLHAHN
jgi:hypothetical protein